MNGIPQPPVPKQLEMRQFYSRPDMPVDDDDLALAAVEVETTLTSVGEETSEARTLAAFYIQLQAEKNAAKAREKELEYAQRLERDLDELERQSKKELADVILASRDVIVSKVKSSSDLAVLANNLVFPYKGDLLDAIRSMLDRARGAGIKDARRDVDELKDDVKDHVENYTTSAFTPRAAMRWLRAKTLWITGIVSDSLVADAKNILLNALKTGEPMLSTIDKLFNAFEPWLGRGSVIADEQALAPHRLATTVRTNTTEAYNQGRLSEFVREDMLPFLIGMRYNAIIDSRTTQVCRFLHGRIFKPTDPDLVSLAPPNHFNCRSILSPVVVGERVEDGDFITPMQRARGKALADQKFLSENDAWQAYREQYESGDTVEMVWDEAAHPRHPAGTPTGGEFAPKIGSSSVAAKADKAAVKAVLEHGSRTGNEMAIVYDPETGEELRIPGEKNYVLFSNEAAAKMRDKVFVHNHPSGYSLSMQDVLMASNVGLREIVAVAQDGTQFRAKPLSNKIQAFEGMRLVKELTMQAALQEWYGPIKRKVFDSRTADYLSCHLVNLVLAKTGFIHYSVENIGPAVKTLLDDVGKDQLDLALRGAKIILSRFRGTPKWRD